MFNSDSAQQELSFAAKFSENRNFRFFAIFTYRVINTTNIGEIGYLVVIYVISSFHTLFHCNIKASQRKLKTLEPCFLSNQSNNYFYFSIKQLFYY